MRSQARPNHTHHGMDESVVPSDPGAMTTSVESDGTICGALTPSPAPGAAGFVGTG